MPDVFLRPKDASLGAHDVQVFGYRRTDRDIKLYARDASLGAHDVQLRPANLKVYDIAVGGAFPTQFAGFKVRKTGSTIELCMVATADAPSGMGGVVRVRKNGTTYALYLVETSDSNASPVRVKTTTGIKSVRLKT